MDKKLYSINQLASELNMDRRTMTARMVGLRPASTATRTNGVELRRYRLADVFNHLCSPTGTDDGPRMDPAQERAALDRVRREQIEDAIRIRRKELIPASVYADSTTSVFKGIAQFFEGIPDDLERKGVLPPAAVEPLVRAIDAQRELLYARIIAIADQMDGEGR